MKSTRGSEIEPETHCLQSVEAKIFSNSVPFA